MLPDTLFFEAPKEAVDVAFLRDGNDILVQPISPLPHTDASKASRSRTDGLKH